MKLWRSKPDSAKALTGRYVGIPDEIDDGISFEEKMGKLTEELKGQMEKESELNEEIKKQLNKIGLKV